MNYIVINEATGEKVNKIFTSLEEAKKSAKEQTRGERELAKLKGEDPSLIQFIVKEAEEEPNLPKNKLKEQGITIDLPEKKDSESSIIQLNSRSEKETPKKEFPEREKDSETLHRTYKKANKTTDKRFKENPLNARLNLLIQADTKKALQKVAKKKGISVNQYILNLIDEELNKA